LLVFLHLSTAMLTRDTDTAILSIYHLLVLYRNGLT